MHSLRDRICCKHPCTAAHGDHAFDNCHTRRSGAPLPHCRNIYNAGTTSSQVPSVHTCTCYCCSTCVETFRLSCGGLLGHLVLCRACASCTHTRTHTHTHTHTHTQSRSDIHVHHRHTRSHVDTRVHPRARSTHAHTREHACTLTRTVQLHPGVSGTFTVARTVV